MGIKQALYKLITSLAVCGPVFSKGISEDKKARMEFPRNILSVLILCIYTGADTGFCSGGGDKSGREALRKNLPPTELLRGGGRFSDNLDCFVI